MTKNRTTNPIADPKLWAVTKKYSNGIAARKGKTWEKSARFACPAMYSSLATIHTIMGNRNGAKKMLK